MSSQFRPKATGGTRKVVESGQGSSIRPVYDNIFRHPPKPEPVKRKGNCKGNDDTCGSWAKKGTEYCVGHLRSMGLLEVADDEG